MAVQGTLKIVIFHLLFLCISSVIILDRGNPVRFIRGAFMDVNQPEVGDASVGAIQEGELFTGGSQTPFSIQSLEESIIEHMSQYNIAMTDALVAEAEKINARSALNMCQFSRSRMTAMQLINDFQSLIVQQQLEKVNANGQPGDLNTALLKQMLVGTEEKFLQMGQDLQQLDESNHGTLPIFHLSAAMKDFATLKKIFSSR